MVSTVSHGNVLDNFDKRVNPMKTSPDSVGQSRDVPNAGSGSTPAGLEDVSSGCERSSTRQSGDTARFVAGTVRWWPTLLAPSDRLNSRLRPEWIDFDEAKGKKLGYAWNECHLKRLVNLRLRHLFMGLGTFLESQSFGHPHQLGQGTGLHFLHHSGAVSFDSSLCGSQVRRYLLVQQS
jgi:hypothetical protein